MKRRRSLSAGKSSFAFVNTAVMVLIIAATLYPFLNVLALSLNESLDSVKGGITFFPRKFTLENFESIFKYRNLVSAFGISVLRTVAGTVAGFTACSMLAYVLSRKDFQARRPLSVFLALTIYVSGGLIPGFILMKNLLLLDSFWVYIFPMTVNAFYVFMIRTFMDGLPFELQESAFMDGANDFTVFYRIVLPMCTPVLAAVSLFLAVGQWNSWFDTYLYNGLNESLSTLQFELQKILQGSRTGAEMIYGNGVLQMNTIASESIKMVVTIVTVVPILAGYPFLQRYFVKGITIGAVKS